MCSRAGTHFAHSLRTLVAQFAHMFRTLCTQFWGVQPTSQNVKTTNKCEKICSRAGAHFAHTFRTLLGRARCRRIFCAHFSHILRTLLGRARCRRTLCAHFVAHFHIFVSHFTLTRKSRATPLRARAQFCHS